MEKSTFAGATLTGINGKGQQFIQLREVVFTKGVATSTKNGFLEVQPKHAKAALKDVQSGAMQVEFGRRNRQTDLYDIIVVQAEEEPAAEGAAAENADATKGEIKQEA